MPKDTVGIRMTRFLDPTRYRCKIKRSSKDQAKIKKPLQRRHHLLHPKPPFPSLDGIHNAYLHRHNLWRRDVLRCIPHVCSAVLLALIQVSFNILSRKDIDGVAYEVDCEMTVIKEGDVDIGMCSLFPTIERTGLTVCRCQPFS